MPTYTHHKLLREQRQELEKNPMSCEERENLLSQIEDLEMQHKRLKNSMTFNGAIQDPLKDTVEY